jgi:hypothetical protein
MVIITSARFYFLLVFLMAVVISGQILGNHVYPPSAQAWMLFWGLTFPFQYQDYFPGNYPLERGNTDINTLNAPPITCISLASTLS